MTPNYDFKSNIGKGLVGFPGSVITDVIPGADYLMHGPLHGEAFGTVMVKLADGRTLRIPKDISRIHTFDRK